MRLSDAQAIRLIHTLYDSTAILTTMGGMSASKRMDFYNKVIHQQDHRIVELSELPGIPEDDNGKQETPTDSPTPPDPA